MPFLFHLLELRLRSAYIMLSLCITFLVSTFYSKSLTYLICLPLSPGRTTPSCFIFTHVTEGLYAAIEVSFVCTFFLCLPLMIYQIYSFFIPSCYQRERYFINTVLFFVILFVIISVIVAYSTVLPQICQFLREFQQENKCLEIKLEARIAPAIRWSCTAFLLTGVFFQIPIFFACLCKAGLSPFFLQKNRKYAYFFLLLITSFFSPADVSIQCILATMGFVFYETLLWCAFFYENFQSQLAKLQ